MPIPSDLTPAIGTALIKHFFGEQFGPTPTFEPISDGIQNYNGFVVDSTGENKLFLSFLRFGQGEYTSIEHLQSNIGFVNKLKEHGLNTPQYLPNQHGAHIFTAPNHITTDDGHTQDVPQQLKGSLVTAQAYCPGTSLSNPVTNDHEACILGRTLAQLHKIADTNFTKKQIASLPSAVSLQTLKTTLLVSMGFKQDTLINDALKNSATATQKITAHIHALLSEKQNPLLSQFLTELQQGWVEKTLQHMKTALNDWGEHKFDDLPKTLCHGDFHAGNMFQEGTIYDMGYLGEHTRIFDICQAIVISCHADSKCDIEAAKKVLQGYQEQVKLTPEELIAMPTMLAVTHIRSTVTRFCSIMNAKSSDEISKLPSELQDRLEHYKTQPPGNWANQEQQLEHPNLSQLVPAKGIQQQ